jgi:O-antigen biosynthesis protein
MPKTDYRSWRTRWESNENELASMKRQIAGFDYLPRISLALTISDADEVWIKSGIDSVLRQLYPYLELCICDNGSVRPHVWEVLADYSATEERIEVQRLPEKVSWGEAYNTAVSMAAGEFVAFLDQGDELAPEALFKVVEALQHVRADVLYTDEDHIDVSGARLDPVFKPYWSPDLFLSTAYIGRLCVIRKELLDASGGVREGFEGAEEHDLILRLSEKTHRIYHLPGMMYHRRTLPARTDSNDAGNEASLRAVEEALARREENATVEPDEAEHSFRVIRRIPRHTQVSVIVSVPEGTNGVSVIEDLQRNTSYPINEIIVAGGEQTAHPTAHHVSHPLHARALNLAADEATSEFLVFVDGSIRVISEGWLSELLSQACRRGVGAAGCRLLNPDGGLRHGGSLIDVSRLVGYPDESVLSDGNPRPLVDQAFNFASPSAGCMMVRKTVFDSVGGFNDERLPTTFYDLDLSFRLREIGLLNVYTPHASLVYEGPAFLPAVEEIEYMWRQWWVQLVRLLYYRWSPLQTTYHGAGEEWPVILSS